MTSAFAPRSFGNDQGMRSVVMRTLGIDLSAEASKTAAVVVDWHDGIARADVLGLPRTVDAQDVHLVAEVKRVDATGIDAPFGWPDDFVAAVTAWHQRQPWSPEVGRRHRYRATDEVIASDPQLPTPLSVSSNLLGVTAWRCVTLLDLIKPKVSRTGEDALFEVYPAASLAAWGFPHQGYKKDRAARTALLAAVRERCPWLELDEASVARTDHAFDALICALSARAAARTLSEPPPLKLRQALLEIEGWIHVPRRGSLDHLAG
jgi:hypothetical protein